MPKPLNILEGESVEEFDALNASIYAERQPATETERFLVDLIVHHEWLMGRAVRMQQALYAAVSQESDADPKKLKLVIRYYRTHERAAAQARREFDSLRKQKTKQEKAATRESAQLQREQRQWEQILKKMPTLTNWVN